ADGSAVALSDGCNRVAVGVVSEGGNAVVLGPSVEHGHAHAVVVGNYYVDGITEGSGPGVDGVSSGSCIPGSSSGVLHLLRSQLTNDVALAVHLQGSVLNDGGGAVGVGSYGVAVDLAVGLNAGSQS